MNITCRAAALLLLIVTGCSRPESPEPEEVSAKPSPSQPAPSPEKRPEAAREQPSAPSTPEAADQASSSESPAADSTASSDSTDSGTPAPPLPAPSLSAQQAAKKGQEALAAALQAERAGNDKQAYEKALQGYQAARSHRQDAACQQAASELLTVLERLGESQASGSRSALKSYRID